MEFGRYLKYGIAGALLGAAAAAAAALTFGAGAAVIAGAVGGASAGALVGPLAGTALGYIATYFLGGLALTGFGIVGLLSYVDPSGKGKFGVFASSMLLAAVVSGSSVLGAQSKVSDSFNDACKSVKQAKDAEGNPVLVIPPGCKTVTP